MRLNLHLYLAQRKQEHYAEQQAAEEIQQGLLVGKLCSGQKTSKIRPHVYHWCPCGHGKACEVLKISKGKLKQRHMLKLILDKTFKLESEFAI